MKMIIVAVFALSIAAIIPTSAFAQLGTIGNPIYIQDVTIPDPFTSLDQRIQQQNLLNALNAQTQTTQNATLQQTMLLLKSQYGLSSYAACASKDRDCNSADPNAQARCVDYVQYCLQLTAKKSQTQQPIIQNIPSTNQPQTSANSGDVSSKLDAMCLAIPNTYLHRGTDGYNKCDCSSGYAWNLSKTACVATQQVQPVANTSASAEVNELSTPISPKSNDRLCQDSYGSHAAWHGTLNSTGGLVCECATGYEVTDGKCNQIPILYRVPVANVQSTTTDSNIDGRSVPTNPKPERRGFWSWILGMFGL